MPERLVLVVFMCASGIVHQCEALYRAGLGEKEEESTHS